MGVLMGDTESHNPKSVAEETRIIGAITVIRQPHIGILHFSKNILNGFKITILFKKNFIMHLDAPSTFKY